MVREEDLEAVLDAYIGGLTDAYHLGLIMACLCAAGTLGMEWVNVRKEGGQRWRRCSLASSQ